MARINQGLLCNAIYSIPKSVSGCTPARAHKIFIFFIRPHTLLTKYYEPLTMDLNNPKLWTVDYQLLAIFPLTQFIGFHHEGTPLRYLLLDEESPICKLWGGGGPGMFQEEIPLTYLGDEPWRRPYRILRTTDHGPQKNY